MPVRAGVCTALIGAAVIHGTVVSEHFALWPLAGLFFLGTQLVEASLAVAAVYAWGRRPAQLVFVTGLGTVLVWLVSRTWGMPVGPAAFRAPEAIGVPDLACCVLELAAAALAAPTAFLPAVRLSHSRPRGRILVAAALAVAALAVTGWGLTPTVAGSANPAGHHAQPQR